MMPGSRTVRSIASSSAGGPTRSPIPGASSAANSAIAAGDQQQRHEPEHPRRHAHPARRGLHHDTSKMPCQPSSVNSDWCAWNMYLPGYGKRHSAIPRWPWHSITVSVSSAGVFDVPVG